MKANKGEWSEIYVLIKLLADSKVDLVDSNLKQLRDLFLDIYEISWDEANSGNMLYKLKDDRDYIKVYKEEKFLGQVNRKDLFAVIPSVFQSILNSKSKTFTINEFEKIRDLLKFESIKSKASKKSDIDLLVLDLLTKSKVWDSFSIKSNLGGASTIVNASSHTHFKYFVQDLSEKDIDIINNIYIDRQNGRKSIDLTARIQKIYELGGRLEFFGMDSKTYQGNLIMIDSLFPEVIAELLLESYIDRVKSIKELTSSSIVVKNIELNKDKVQNIVSSFIYASVTSMMPSKEWSKVHETKGLLVVKKDGDVVAFYIYNRDELWKYLLDNCVLDTPSTSRHKIGTVYEKDGDYLLDLSLQVRIKQ